MRSKLMSEASNSAMYTRASQPPAECPINDIFPPASSKGFRIKKSLLNFMLLNSLALALLAAKFQ